MALGSWPSPGFMLGTGYVAADFGWQLGSPTPTQILENVATAYRSASGHAVAIVLGPMGASLDPMRCGQPWPQFPTSFGCLSVG